MAKFNKSVVKPTTLKTGGMKTSLTPTTRTFEGGVAYKPDDKSELFKLAVTNFVNQDTFYESARKRDSRFVQLVHVVTKADPVWMQGFARWLRDGANMRSAAVVVAAEYVKAGGPNGRSVISSVCLRPDEPAEVLGYWFGTYGRALPMPVKRGVADAAARLYTEKNVLKYDGNSQNIRFADVVRLCHVKPTSPTQSTLFKWLSESRKETVVPPVELVNISSDYVLQRVDKNNRPAMIDKAIETGWSWERFGSWLGNMDAKAWEAVIPNMGAMALTRNLRNFEQANISKSMVTKVRDKISDPAEVVKSKQFPFRFLSAWKNTTGVTYASALEDAVEAATQNVPVLSGKTLIMLDVSGSMLYAVSRASGSVVGISRYEAAAVFAGAIARRSDCDVVPYSTYVQSMIPSKKVGSILRFAGSVAGMVGGGTNTWMCTMKAFQSGKYDRIIILTDEQTSDRMIDVYGSTPIYTFNLGGYAPSHNVQGVRNRYAFAGFSDACFQIIPLIESNNGDSWPWEVK